MTKDEALKMCLEYIETNAHERRCVRWAIKEALAEPEQEPVAYLCENAAGHKYFRWKKPSSVYKPIALYTTPPQRTEERNFCPRCGKRTVDLTTIHTCTPPQTIADEHIAKVTSDIDLAVNKALAQPEQEPVARVIDNGTPEGATEWIPFTSRVEPLKTGDLLYTTPPQRPWVGLTNNELQPIADEYRILFGSWVEDFARAIEAKLKEKNT